MSRLPWLLLLFALAGATGLGYVVHTSAARGPADYLDAARSFLEEEPQDVQSAFRELNFGIELAERRRDDTVLSELLAERGALFRRRQAFNSAEDDFVRLLDNEFFDRQDALRELAEIDLARREFDDAEAHADEMLEAAPGHGGYLTLRGRIRRARLDTVWDDLESLIREYLPDMSTGPALKIAEEVVYLPEYAPLRATRLNELDQLVAGRTEEDDARFDELIGTANRMATEARSDFEAALSKGAFSVSAFNLLEMHRLAGRHWEAVQLGLTLQRFPDPSKNREFLQLLALNLADLDRGKGAERVVEAALPEQGGIWMDRSFLPTWSRVLYENRSWGRLTWVAEVLGATNEQSTEAVRQRSAAHFYRGIALSKGVNAQAGAVALRNYVVPEPLVEPVPNAVGEAWLTMAKLAKERGDNDAYRSALMSCTAKAPTYSGEAWLMLADFRIEKNYPLVEPLVALTHALSLMPERVDELLPRWHDLGQRSLLESDRDLELVRSKLIQKGEWFNEESGSPYEQYRLAQMHRDAGEAGGAISVCRRLLASYPQLLPVIDLQIEIYTALGQMETVVPMLLERLRLEPGDPSTLARLRQLDDEGLLSPAELLLLMRLDPGYTGVLVLGRELLETGGADLAAKALSEGNPATLGTPGRLLAAEIDLRRGRPEKAMLNLLQVEPNDPLFASVIRRRVEAATAMNKIEQVAQVLGGVAQAEQLDTDELLIVTQDLLLQRQWAPALLLLERMDQLPGNRSGEVVAQLALAEMLARRPEAARETLERVLAFRDDGVAEMGELLMAVQERNWTDLPARVRAIRRTSYEPTELGACLLAALEERLDEADGLARAGEAEAAETARWTLARRAIQSLRSEPLQPWGELGIDGVAQTDRFLRGTPNRPRDPRRALAILMALEFDEWSVWALAELGNLTADPSAALWPTFLASQAQLRLGHVDAAATLLRALTVAFPQFHSAWDVLIDLEREQLGRPEHPILLQLRAERAAALGGPEGDAPDQVLARALEDEAAGRLDRALALTRSVLDRQPDHLAAQLVLGRIRMARKEHRGAVNVYGRFIADADEGLAYEYAPAFLSALDFARSSNAIEESTFVAELQSLSAKLPQDPLVVVHRARHEIDSQPDSLPIGIGRAWLLLDQFRERTDGAALDSLRPGTTRIWLDLILPYDPDRAERFIESELALQPQSLELWLMLGRVYEAQGRRADAARHYDVVQSMVPAPAALFSAAVLQAELGLDPDRVNELIDRVRRMEERSNDDPELALLRARSLVNSGGDGTAQGLEILRNLWGNRRTNEARLPILELAQPYALACLHHGDLTDRAGAQAAMKLVLEANTDGARAKTLTLLETYTRRIPAKPEEPESPTDGANTSADGAAAATGTGPRPTGNPEAPDGPAADSGPGARADGVVQGRNPGRAGAPNGQRRNAGNAAGDQPAAGGRRNQGGPANAGEQRGPGNRPDGAARQNPGAAGNAAAQPTDAGAATTPASAAEQPPSDPASTEQPVEGSAPPESPTLDPATVPASGLEQRVGAPTGPPAEEPDPGVKSQPTAPTTGDGRFRR